MTLTSDGHTYERADKVSLQRLLPAKKKKVMIFTQSFSKGHTGVFCFPGDGKYTNCCQEGQVLHVLQVLPYNALPKTVWYDKLSGLNNLINSRDVVM